MSNNNRSIEEFPYTRENAERIISKSKDVLKAMRSLSEYISEIPQSKTPQMLLQHSFLDAVDFTMQFEELLQRTFPELLPVDWAFDHA